MENQNRKNKMKKISEILNSIYKIVSNRLVLIGAIVLLIFLSIRQCERANGAEADSKRQHNNYLAMQDSVRAIKKEKDHLIVEKSAMELKVSELSDEQKRLITKLGLKDNGKSTTPSVVTEIQIVYVDRFINVPTKVEKDKDGKESITFTHSPKMKGNNSLTISGKIPYTLDITKSPDKEDLVFTKLNTGPAELDIKQNIEIITGIYRDPETKRLMTRVSTEYPGIDFKDVNSFTILDTKENRDALKAARKPYGIGVNFGIGLAANQKGIGPGIYLGIGLQYSPKFLQFGK
jgi:hypothetical protein